MKCRMFALSLALGALLCLAPSAAALEPQPEGPAPDTAEPAGQALTEEVTKEVTVTVEVPILPEKPPIQISYTTPEEIGFTWEEDGLELEVAEVLPVEEISLAPDADEVQKAMAWAVENELIDAHRKADFLVSRVSVIRAWNKAQKLAAAK